MKPIRFQWTDDGHMVPHPHAARLCDREFVIGEWYTLVVHEERSSASERHYHACVREVWQNLPAHLAAKFPDETYLRKYALVRCGFWKFYKQIHVPDPKVAAEIIAALRAADEYTIIVYGSDRILNAWVPKSQKRGEMSAKEWKEAKEKVLNYLSELIGTDAATLHANAGRAA